MIRADIALARTDLPTPTQGDDVAMVDPIAHAPNGIQFDVAVRHDCEIVVTIVGVPTAWGWVDDGGLDLHSPALRALVDEIASIINSYNHSGQDITNRFSGRVRVGDATVVW
ncbi:hypothetical protein [Rhodococcus sp. MALMAid1271]|uniref:hypothetical protein n=1 Tax=Rhodococcus sp. MALMAid1271 TaxID=3411744 RepID=UPI003BA1438F